MTVTVAMPDTAYRVATSPNAQETIWVASKTTPGFTLKSSKTNSTAGVDRIVAR